MGVLIDVDTPPCITPDVATVLEATAMAIAKRKHPRSRSAAGKQRENPTSTLS
jgi:hypothetical protein